MYGGNGGDGKLLALQKQLRELSAELLKKTASIGDALQDLREQILQTGERFSNIDYATLLHKPKINGVELNGEKSLSDLGAAAAADVPVIGYIDETSAQDYTLTSGGYRRLTVPSSFPNGAKLFSITVLEYSTATGAFYPIPYGSTQAYIIGTPEAVIRGLKCRYWHIK